MTKEFPQKKQETAWPPLEHPAPSPLPRLRHAHLPRRWLRSFPRPDDRKLDWILHQRLGGKPLPLPDGTRSMAKPRGIGRGKGKGLPGPAIMVMAKVWLICVLVAPSLLGGDRGCGAGGVRGLELEFWARPPAVAALLGGILSGGGSAPWGARGNAELPGRGLLEFPRCGKVFDRCGRDDMVICWRQRAKWR